MISNLPSLSKKQAQAIVTIFVGCLLFGFALSYSYVKLASKRATSKPAILTLTADKKEVKIGEKFLVKIELDSKNQGVGAADFVLNFDPSYLQPIKLSEGNFFKTYPVKKVEENFIKISGMANLEGNTIMIPKGKGLVATIVFQAEKETKGAEIVFDKEKTVVASAGKNILGKTSEVKVKVVEK